MALTLLVTSFVRKLNGHGFDSPSCRSIVEKSMLFLSSLAGVPVFRRPSLKPARSSVDERPDAGDSLSPRRPAGNARVPFRNYEVHVIAIGSVHTDMDFSSQKCPRTYDHLAARNNLSCC